MNWAHCIRRNHTSSNNKVDLTWGKLLGKPPQATGLFKSPKAPSDYSFPILRQQEHLLKPSQFSKMRISYYFGCQNTNHGLGTHSCHAPFAAFSCGESTKVVKSTDSREKRESLRNSCALHKTESPNITVQLCQSGAVEV